MNGSVDYEWDEEKAASNLLKHGVAFTDAVRVFEDPDRLVTDTTRIVDGEERLKAVGAVEGRLFAVVFTFRGDGVRLISARRTNRSEERSYGDRPLHP